MRMKVFFVVWMFLASCQIFSQPAQFFPLSDVKPGLKGVAKSVFSGTKPSEYNVEIFGVLEGGIGPKQDMIIGRLSGGEADRTFVFAGMSGSPVYVDGKLLGAISYSFPFSKEPICGITPISQMISIFEKNPNVAKLADSPKSISGKELSSLTLSANRFRTSSNETVISNSNFPSLLGQTIRPIAVPLTFGGFSQETLNQFSPQLLSAGLMPVSSIGGTAKVTPMKTIDDKTLLGGSSVSFQLSRGDMSIAAAGTVTYRDGEKIYAFGHPWLSLGSSDLPMSESHVVTVVPNLNNSFKLDVPDSLVGTMTQDRSTGVFGKLGQMPKMIPVKLNVKTSRGNSETYNFEIAKDDFLSPILVNISIANALQATERGLGDATVKVNGKINIKGQEPITIERRFSNGQATGFAAGSMAVPMSVLLGSGFQAVEITNINVDLVSNDGTKTALLEKIILDRAEVKPGETFGIKAFLRSDTGEFFIQNFTMKVPEETPAGTLLVTLGDGNSANQTSASRQFVPKTLAELIQNINKVRKNDRFYAQLSRVTNGAIIGSSELPNLPPSVLATINNDRTAGGISPTVLTTIAEQEIAPNEFVVFGQQVLTIDVVK
jgi:hypothetical protein